MALLLLVGATSCTQPVSPPDWRYYDPSTDEVSVGAQRAKRFKTYPASELGSLYLTACQAGSGPACHRLGTLHVGGIGVAANENRAKELFLRACELEDSRGCFAVKHGPNLKDPRFLPIMGAWCDERRVEGCVQLAVAFEYGDPAQHIPKDLARALELYREACVLQHRPSCEHMLDVAITLDAQKPKIEVAPTPLPPPPSTIP